MGQDMGRGMGKMRGFHRTGPGELKGSVGVSRDLPMLSDQPGIAAIIDAVMQAGDAIILGATSDGGAVSITVLSGKERLKGYAGDDDELHELLVDLAGKYLPQMRVPRDTLRRT